MMTANETQLFIFDRSNADACGAARKYECLACGAAWCHDCDPAPAACCHYCHGRGHSLAEIVPPADQDGDEA